MLKEYKGEKTVLNQYKREERDPIHKQLKDELEDWLTDKYLLHKGSEGSDPCFVKNLLNYVDVHRNL